MLGGSILAASWSPSAAAQPAPGASADAAPSGSVAATRPEPRPRLGPLTGRVLAYVRAPWSDPAHDPWQQASSSAWLQVHPRLDDHVYAHAVASGDAIATSATLSDHVRVRLREAFAAVARNGWEARLGQQIVPWGNADGFNPTDLLSSWDMRFFSGDPEVRRAGAPMLWAAWTPNDGESPLQLTAVATPVFTSSHVLMRPDLLPPA
jgi:hypothetical protein